MADVAIKRRALRIDAEVIDDRFIVDRLHVRPATPMEDGAIRDLVRDACWMSRRCCNAACASSSRGSGTGP